MAWKELRPDFLLVGVANSTAVGVGAVSGRLASMEGRPEDGRLSCIDRREERVVVGVLMRISGLLVSMEGRLVFGLCTCVDVRDSRLGVNGVAGAIESRSGRATSRDGRPENGLFSCADRRRMPFVEETCGSA